MRDINRRDVLKGIGVAGVSGLAGRLELQQEGPDVLNVIGYPQSGIQLFRDFYQMGRDVDIIVPDGLQQRDLPAQVGNDMQNVTGTAPTAAGPNRQAFVEMFQDEYGESPGVFTSHTYDAVAILTLANAAAGENNGTAIRDQIRRVSNPPGDEYGPGTFVEAVEAAANGDDINYQGASSSVDFDERGDPASAAYDIWTFAPDTESGFNTEDTVEFETGESGGPMADSAPGGMGREIMVGILLPETGDLGSLGVPMIQAGQLPVQQVNDSDLDLTVRAQVEDTQTERQASLSGANALLNAGFPAICGPASSGNNVPVSQEVYIPNEVVGMSPSSTALSVSFFEDDDFIFRTAPSDLLQGQVMAQVAAERLGGSTASTLFVNNDYGQQLSEQFVETFQDDHGGEVFQQVAFNIGESSYSSVINQALSGSGG